MKHRRTHWISTGFFLLLFLVGLGILLYPTFSDWYVKWRLGQEIEQYNRVTQKDPEEYAALWAEVEAYNRSVAEKENQFQLSAGEQEQIDALLAAAGSHLMGYIEIPDIQVRLPIYPGTEEKQLQSGAGWWIGSSLPGGGAGTHCVITAHTGLAKAKLFTDLDKLSLGDRFTLSVLDRTLLYEVDQIRVCDPTDMSCLTVISGGDYVTLYTCTPYGVNTERLLVRGRRVSETEAAPAALPAKTPRRGVQLMIWLCAASLLFLIILLLIYIWRRKHKNKEKKYAEMELSK